MEESVLVSIITPTYNCESFILETINSVRSQTFDDWEMIIIDDKSNDNTIELVEEAKKVDKRIKLFALEENLGAGAARNKGIEMSSGRFIAFLDSDDKWHSDKLEKQLDFMLKNNYHFSFTAYQQIDEDSRAVIKNVKVKKKVTYSKALYNNPIGCLTAMYDTEYLGNIYMPTIRKRQDYALWLKILKKTNGYGLNDILAFYTVRNSSISSNKLNLIKHQWKLYRDIEKFSMVKSAYYVCFTIINKLMKG